MKFILKLSVFTIIVLSLIQFPQADSERDKHQGVILSPSLNAIDVNRNEKKEIKIYIRNNEKVPVKVEYKIQDIKYIYEPDQKIQVFNTESSELQKLVTLKTDIKDLEIKPWSSVKLTFEVNVPADEPTKGYYGIIVFNFIPQGEGSQALKMHSQIASTVHIRVLGADSNYNLNLIFNSVQSFSFIPKFDFYTEILNKSDSHFHPIGYIEIFDPEGTRQTKVFRVNPNFDTLMPGQKIKQNDTWNEKINAPENYPLIGKYKATLTVIAEENQQELGKKTIEIFVLPYHYLIYGFIVILVFTGIYFVRARKIKINLDDIINKILNKLTRKK